MKNDFITKHDSLEDTENYYGKNSIQYEIHKFLLEIEKDLGSTGDIKLCKECKGEFIVIAYNSIFNSPTSPRVIRLRTKYYFNKERTRCLKKKRISYLDPRSIHDVVFNDIRILIYENGYEICNGKFVKEGVSIIDEK